MAHCVTDPGLTVTPEAVVTFFGWDPSVGAWYVRLCRERDQRRRNRRGVRGPFSARVLSCHYFAMYVYPEVP